MTLFRVNYHNIKLQFGFIMTDKLHIHSVVQLIHHFCPGLIIDLSGIMSYYIDTGKTKRSERTAGK